MRSILRRPAFHRMAIVPLACVTFALPAAFAQSTDAGTITGTVTDPSGALIAGATITLVDPTTKSERKTNSNKSGQYVLQDVQPAVYKITAFKAGFSTDEIPDLTVSVGTQSTANFKMSIGAETTTIDVVAANTDLQTMNASTGTTVDPKLVESLPAIGRDVAQFVTLQPGVTPGGNVAGTTVDQTTFQLDGGSNSSDMDGTAGVYTSNNVGSTSGGFIAGGAGGVVPMPQDSIEEFKVSTTGQTADFNNSSGSQSQIVTKRGHDKLHGTVYEYYLDNNFNGNTWQNNFPTTSVSAYTAKPSYHYSRFGAAAGGPVLPNKFGGKTYLFANYEGFRYPLAATYERTVPSYEYLQLGQLTFAGNLAGCSYNATAKTSTCSAAQLKAADPRGIGFNPTVKNFYNTQLPVAPAGNGGGVGTGVFDPSCGALSTAYCDGTNLIGFRANVLTPQSSDFLAARLDHDFGSKNHLTASYRYYRFINLTSNQVDIGGVLPGDKLGVPTAVTPRPQQPSYYVVGLTTTISSSLTNDFHLSYTHNFWQWKGAGAPPQISGAGGVIEPLGESSNTTVLAPYNVNAQNIRTRIWNGKDIFLRDDLSKLKGNHFIQFGGQFQRNRNYHQRTDNGASINYTPTYQLGDAGGGGNVAYSAAGLGLVGANANISYARQLDSYYGIVTDTQVANTYTNTGGNLTLNPPATPISATDNVPYYNLYATDTWHALPSLTLNYGISYAIEMPPTEINGNQVLFTDAAGNALPVESYLSSRQSAAATGQIYNPEIGFALVHNVVGSRKYPYDPFYGAVSPRLSASWNPKFKNEALDRIFGHGDTVIRGGYGRLYGRINGDAQTLNPILSPGLILATQCKYVQSSTTGTGNCNQAGFTDTSVYRFGSTSQGLDGVSPVLASAPAPAKLTQPYHPGFDGPGVQLASPVDPTLRPNDVDSFNLSVQRQINRKMLVEVGYIGRNIHHEYIQLNPNQIPYNLSQGGQSFVAAYDVIESFLGCTVSSSMCAKSTPTLSTITPQPFFETALGGAGSAYCVAYTSCTAAVLAKQTGKFRAQQVFGLWQALDNNVNGAGGAGWVFPRSLMGTATSNSTYGSAGQVVTGLSMGTAQGYSNYNGGYVSFKANNFHGMTLQENLTFSKALGLGSYNQSTSSIAAEDNWNLKEQYGRQGFDEKIIFNTFIVYQTPWYRDQHGLVGRLAGGWTLSPVVTAGTGQPLQCVSNNNGQNFGGEDGANFTDGENCIFLQQPGGRTQTIRGILGGADPLSVNVGTAYKLPGGSSAINVFSNPVNTFDSTRPPILGIDQRDGGAGPISGLAFLNLDASIKKNIVVFEKFSIEASGVFLNVLNHNDFTNPSLSLQSSTAFGVTKSQGNTPRQIEAGIRANF